jgi:hypothetical protein
VGLERSFRREQKLQVAAVELRFCFPVGEVGSIVMFSLVFSIERPFRSESQPSTRVNPQSFH